MPGVKKIIVSSKSKNYRHEGGDDEHPNMVIIKDIDSGGVLEVCVPDDGYFPGTKEEIKGKEKWIASHVPVEGMNFDKEDACNIVGKGISIRISKKLCGSAIRWLEAFHNSPENKKPSGFYYRGECQPKIVSIKWHLYQSDNKGREIIENDEIKYGDIVQLHIKTEGLNGDMLNVSFIEDEEGSKLDQVNDWTYMGNIIINFPIKMSWRAKFFNGLEVLFGDELEITPVVSSEVVGDKLILPKKRDIKPLVVKNEWSDTSRNKGKAVPVSIGKVALDPKKYEPCLFTAIKLKSGKREYYFFKEKKVEGDADQFSHFKVVSGKQKGKNEVTILAENLTSKYCRSETSHEGKNIIYGDAIKDKVVRVTDSEIKIDAVYNYPNLSTKNKSIGNVLMDYTNNLVLPFSYIWPMNNTPVSYEIEVNSCRYPHRQVFIDAYPDVKWTLQFFYCCKNPIKYRDSWVRMRQYRVDDAVKKAQASDIDGYDGNVEMKFGFAFGAEWNNKTQKAEFGKDWSKKIAKFLLFFMKIKSTVNALSHKNKVNKGSMGAAILNRLKRKPISIEIYSPGLGLDFEWYLEGIKSKEYTYEVGTVIKGTIKFDPLIGGEGRLDLFAVAQQVPAIGQVLKALDVVMSLVNVDPVFDIIAIGKIAAEGTAEFNTFGREFQKAEIGIKGKFGLKIELAIKAKGNVKAIVFEADYEFEASGMAESYFTPKLSFGADDKGIFVDASVGFTGIKVVLVLKAKVRGLKRNIKNEFVIVEKNDELLGKKYYLNKD